MFHDRDEAADRLAQRLAHLQGQRPLILAIPRGGVPMGRRLADALDGELDVVLVRKIGAPGNPEYAIGALSETGAITLDPAAARVAPAAVEREIARQRECLIQRRARYTPVRPPIAPDGRVVVVVDDGSATGATMAAALTTLAGRPARLIAALAVASPAAHARLAPLADELVCLAVPEAFLAVGQFFTRFDQVDDTRVIELLRGD